MDRRQFLKKVCAAGAAAGSCAGAAVSQTKRNVLMICVDDLRPVMGCYGGKALTPNIDRFARESAMFENHYVQWPVCGPSRGVLLGGMRPDTGGIFSNNRASAVANRPKERPTMPLHFRNNGYVTLGFGKVYHGKGAAPGCGWSDPPWQPPGGWTCYVEFPYKTFKKGQWRPAYEIYDGPDNLHGDYQTADKAMEALEQNKDKPFFICAGFYKPHLPFVAPKRYWDLYDKQIERLKPLERPQGSLDYAYRYSEIWAYGDQEGKLYSEDRPPSHEHALDMTRAYYSSVSFADAQIGRLLERLDELGLRDNTAVLIWGDHGFHLGDQDRWAKHTQFEADMRSPLLIRAPGTKQRTGPLETIAETVDIYPTLCDYCQRPPPPHVDGTSLIPVVTGKDTTGKEAAYSQYRPVPKEYGHLMIYTVRTHDYRYIQWRDTKNNLSLVHEELYDLRTTRTETLNVHNKREYKPALNQCRKLIPKGFKSLANSAPT